jgi:hypothetical protein
MYVYNGSVGIGTTSPGSKLHINGVGTNDGLQINTVKTYVTERLAASGEQARRFEIARLGIDYNDWNGGIGPFIVEIFEAYYSRGLYKRYVVNYGYSQNSSCDLVEYQGSGDNQYRVTISSPVQVSGDNYYISVYVDVRYYGQCDVRIQTNRTRTSNSTPGIGETYVNLNPSATNISDFTPDSQVTLARNANAYLVGNVGIGTTTPKGKLAVEGVALIGETTSGAYVTTSKLHIAGTGTGQMSFEDIGAATSGMALDGTNFSIGHQDANVTYYFRHSNTYNGDYANTGTVLAAFNKDNSYFTSNVGIGTTAPGYLLDVRSGPIYQRQVTSGAGIQWHWQAWIGRYDAVQTASQYPNYLPGAAYGFHATADSDACFFGLITRGGSSNDYNTVIAWGDDGGDILQFRFNNGTIGELTDGGIFRVSNDIVAYYSFSDARLKTNIKALDSKSSLNKILQLQGVEYEWKDGARTGKKEIGFVAQDVEPIVPEIVRETQRLNDETLYKQVDYEHLVALLTEAIKELKADNDDLRSLITELQNK